MSSVQLTQYLLWKTLKQKQTDTLFLQQSYTSIAREEIVYPSEMICRVCANPADVPLTDKIGDLYILSAIRTVANISIDSTDLYPKYVCLSCLDELKIALEFKKKCESSDFMFRKSSSDRRHINNSPPMVFHDFALILHQMRQRSLLWQGAAKPESNSNKRRGLSRELNVFEENEINTQNITPHKCRRCDLSFDTKESLIEHRLQRSCVCPPCPLCGKLVSNLSRHNKIVHLRTDKYTCHVCGKISYSPGGLRSHLLVHSDKCEYSCPHCSYKGKQQAYLTLHMRVHTGERPYLCSQCPAKFVNPSNLRKHQLTHSNKEFQCNKCLKRFRLQKTLQEHYDAAHLNMRYRCSICGRDLWTRRKLLSHELRVHNREKHKLYEEVYKVVVNDDLK